MGGGRSFERETGRGGCVNTRVRVSMRRWRDFLLHFSGHVATVESPSRSLFGSIARNRIHLTSVVKFWKHALSFLSFSLALSRLSRFFFSLLLKLVRHRPLSPRDVGLASGAAHQGWAMGGHVKRCVESGSIYGSNTRPT